MFSSYIDRTWYRDIYPSVNKFTRDDTGLDKAIFNASRVIDKITYRRATLFDSMTADEQLCIKYAVAAQVDYIAGLGYEPIGESRSSHNGGFSIGKYSEQAVSQNEDVRWQDQVSEQAMEYLRYCNLTLNGFSNSDNPAKQTFEDWIYEQTNS